MVVYLMFYITNSILSFFKKNKYIFFFFGFLFMFAILALRSENLGVDLDNYEKYYTFYSEKDFTYVIKSFSFPYFVDKTFDVEYGYIFWGWILSNFNISFHGFLVINSLIYSIIISWFIGKYSKNPFLSLILLMGFGIFEYNFCILRQSLSVCLLLLSVPLVKKKKMLSYMIMIFLAFMFHRSSILFLPIYFIYKIKLDFLSVLLFLLVVVALIPFSPLIYSTLYNDVLSRIGKGLYISNSFSLNIILVLFLVMHILLLLLLKNKNAANKLRKYSVFIYMCFVGELIEIFATINSSFGRIAIMTYLNGAIILIPNIVNDIGSLIKLRLSKKSKNMLIKMAIIAASFILFIHSICNSSMRIVPYYTQFEEVEKNAL